MSLYQAKSFVQHWVSAKTAHGIHSPMVFEMLDEVFDSKKQFYIFEEIESLRKKLIRSRDIIQVEDLGAGAKRNAGIERRVSHIAKLSLKKPKYAQLLFRLATWSKAKKILELGTSLGITTAYLAKYSSDAQVLTLEGCPNISKIARTNFNALKLKNITLVTGPFKDILNPELRKLKKVDLAFIDGNHTYEGTIQNFDTIFKFVHPGSIVVLDDIHWSKGMFKAWEQITTRREVSVSIDLFEMGIVFFRDGIEKQKFKIRV